MTSTGDEIDHSYDSSICTEADALAERDDQLNEVGVTSGDATTRVRGQRQTVCQNATTINSTKRAYQEAGHNNKGERGGGGQEQLWHHE